MGGEAAAQADLQPNPQLRVEARIQMPPSPRLASEKIRGD